MLNASFCAWQKPVEGVCTLAKEVGITLLQTDKTLYASCGLLYIAGLEPCERGDF